jgi:signal transduction histidine kinase
VRSQLFHPFFTTKSDGTGLGLSIVHRIVEEHGGSVEVRSELGVGTIFSIILKEE